MEFEKTIKQRASIRDYSDKDVSDEKVLEIINAANKAPSPGNLSILKFIIVKDEEKITKIAQACQQAFIAEAPVLVVVCSDLETAEKMYDERAEKYVKQHAGAAIENFLLKVTDLKLASCWIGAFSEVTIKNILKIPNNIEVEAVLPIAYQAKSDKTTQRQKHDIINLIYFEEWKNKFSKPVTKVRQS